MKLYIFWTLPLSIIRSFSLYTAMVYIIQVCYVQWKTPDDGHRNRLKHVEFHSKNKFEKVLHLVGFIIRNHCKLLWDICGKKAVFCFLCSIIHFFLFYIIVLILSQRPFGKLLRWWVNCHCTERLWAKKFVKKGTFQSETNVFFI
jgi:hypothetical protein